jgi:hypothetical protein
VNLALAFVGFLILLGTSVSSAQEPSKRDQNPPPTEAQASLPEKPEPVEPKAPHAVHHFLDTPGNITIGSNLAVSTLDAVGTCRTLGTGGHEIWLPTQHCAPASLLIYGGFAFDVSLAYIFHRTGHHKLERIAEIVGPADSIAGISYSVTHKGKW